MNKASQNDPDDNPTIGLILCSGHNNAVTEYSVLKDSEQMFATKYLPYVATEEELRRELERERTLVQHKIEEHRGAYAFN